MTYYSDAGLPGYPDLYPGLFYHPVNFKSMNMCACETNYQPGPGENAPLEYVRTRPCAADPCYGDLSCRYASRELPRWGLPAMIPSFNPAIIKGMPPHNTFSIPAESYRTAIQQNVSPQTQVKTTYKADKIKYPKIKQSFQPDLPLPLTAYPRRGYLFDRIASGIRNAFTNMTSSISNTNTAIPNTPVLTTATPTTASSGTPMTTVVPPAGTPVITSGTPTASPTGTTALTPTGTPVITSSGSPAPTAIPTSGTPVIPTGTAKTGTTGNTPVITPVGTTKTGTTGNTPVITPIGTTGNTPVITPVGTTGNTPVITPVGGGTTIASPAPTGGSPVLSPTTTGTKTSIPVLQPTSFSPTDSQINAAKTMALNGYYAIGEAAECSSPGIIGKIIGTGEQKTSKSVVAALLFGALVGYYYGNK